MIQTTLDFEKLSQPVIKPAYLFFDTETTGLPKNYNAPITDFDNWPRLVQIAWQAYDEEGNLLSENSLTVKPDGFEIPTQASDIHGITTEKALAEGISLVDALNEFIAILKATKNLVAHNMSYDIKIMQAEFLRTKLVNDLDTKPAICTKELATGYCAIVGPYGFKWPKLSELHTKLFGVDFEDAHDALVDVRATAKCFWEMKKQGIIQD